MACAGGLNIGVVGRAILTQHQRQAGHALAADDANLNARLADAVSDDGGKAALDEIDTVDAGIGRLQLGKDR